MRSNLLTFAIILPLVLLAACNEKPETVNVQVAVVGAPAVKEQVTILINSNPILPANGQTQYTMKLVEPPTDIDFKMNTVTPDPDIDYKIIIVGAEPETNIEHLSEKLSEQMRKLLEEQFEKP